MRRPIVLLCLMVMLILPELAFASAMRTSGLFTYEIKGNGSATIVKYDWNQSKGDVHVPNMIDGYLVTEIGSEAFAGEWNKWDPEVTITLPDSIVSIGSKAFFGASINRINIPDNIKLVGPAAFVTCSNSVNYIVSPDHEVFATIKGYLYNKREKELIAANSHLKYERLNTYEVPEGIRSIGDYAFFNTSLGKLSVPQTVVKVGDYSFADSYTNELSMDISKLTKIGKHAFSDSNLVYKDAFKNFSIPLAISVVEDYSFASTSFLASGLNSLDIHSGVTHIRQGAFQNRGLEKIQIPGNIIEIAENAFAGNYIAKQISIIEGVKTIGNKAFENCWDVESLSLPSSIAYVGKRAFANNERIIDLELTALNLEIDDEAFLGWEELKSVQIGDGVVSLGKRVFAECDALTNVILGNDLVRIENDAFNTTKVMFTVNEGTYAELWVQENGCAYQYFDSSDSLEWLMP